MQVLEDFSKKVIYKLLIENILQRNRVKARVSAVNRKDRWLGKENNAYVS